MQIAFFGAHSGERRDGVRKVNGSTTALVDSLRNPDFCQTAMQTCTSLRLLKALVIRSCTSCAKF